MSQDEYTRALDAKFAVAYALGWLGDDCGDDEVVVRLRNVSAYLESVLSGLRAEPKPEEKPCESCAALEEKVARLTVEAAKAEAAHDEMIVLEEMRYLQECREAEWTRYIVRKIRAAMRHAAERERRA